MAGGSWWEAVKRTEELKLIQLKMKRNKKLINSLDSQAQPSLQPIFGLKRIMLLFLHLSAELEEEALFSNKTNT